MNWYMVALEAEIWNTTTYLDGVYVEVICYNDSCLSFNNDTVLNSSVTYINAGVFGPTAIQAQKLVTVFSQFDQPNKRFYSQKPAF